MASLGRLTLDLVTQIAGFEEGMNKAERRAQSASQNITKSFDMASMAAKTFGGIVAGLTVGQVINIADEYTQMAAQIKNATTSQQEYDLVQKHLLETANTTYRSLREAQQVYLDVGGALKAYGATTEQALRITDSLSFSFTHNATASDKAKSATDAFMKSIYSGKVGSQQWITILSAVPSIVDDLADSMGVSREEILKLGNAGKITSQQLNTALDSSREKSERLANEMSNSLADGMNNLRNAFQTFVGEANIAFDVTNNMAAVLGILAGNLDVVAGAAGVYAVALAVKMTPAIVSNAAAFSASTIESARYQIALARMSAQAAGTSASLTVLGGAARAALTILGGPVGLALTVGTVAASYALFRDKTEESTASLRENNIAVSDAIEKYKELDKVKQRQQLGAEKEKLDELQKSYESTSTSLISYSLKIGRNSGLTKESARELSALIMQFKLGKISLEELSNRINANNNLTQEQKDKFNNLAGGVRDAGTEFKNQKQFVDAISDALNNTGNAGNNAAAGIKNATNALSDYAAKALKEAQTIEMANALIRQGHSPDYAQDLARARTEKGEDLTDEETEALKRKNDALVLQRKLIDNLNKKDSSAKKQASSAAKEAKEAVDNAKRIAELRASIEYDYADEALKRQIDYQREVGRLQEAGMTQYIAIAKERYDADVQYAFDTKKLEETELAYNLYAFRMTEEEKLTAQARIEDMRIRMSREYSEQEKQSRMNALKAQYDFEIEQIKRVQAERANELHVSMTMQKAMAESRRYDSLAQLVMTPSEYAEWDLQNRMSHESASVNNTYHDNVKKANELTDVEARNKALLEAEEAYQADKWAIEQEYALRSKNLAEENSQYQMRIWGSMLSMGQNMFSQLTQAAIDGHGEQSKSYRAAFLTQQAFAMGSALVSAHLAAAQAASDPSITLFGAKIAASQAMLGMGYTNVGMIAAQTISGMAHSGIDNIPREGTWLLDKGERVLSPRQNADLTKYLNQKNAGSNVGDINVSVVVNSDGTSSTDVQGDSKQLGAMIANAVRQVIIKEKRQGGLLS